MSVRLCVGQHLAGRSSPTWAVTVATPRAFGGTVLPRKCRVRTIGQTMMKNRLRIYSLVMVFALSVAAKDTTAYEFNDSHFHLKNYIQKGLSAKEFLEIMGNIAGRVALFGIPLQQKWDYALTGDRAPDYYLLSKARLYYYSAVDAVIAEEYLSLSLDDQKRFDPMITGFNPTDMYATDHILGMLKRYPGVFSGIGEFSIHKEFVSGKIAGHAASLTNKALDKILELSGDVGLVVILHNDIDEVRPAVGEPVYLAQLKALFKRHQETSVIWAHTGLGRFIRPSIEHVEILDTILSDPELEHVNFDISWDEVAKYVTESDVSVQMWADLMTRHNSRFLFGTDSVAPQSQQKYAKTYRDYQKLWDRLDNITRRKVAIENYERVFDAANRRVRDWEMKNFKTLTDAVPEKHYYYSTIIDEVEKQIKQNTAN